MPRRKLKYQSNFRSTGSWRIFICPPHWSIRCHLINISEKGVKKLNTFMDENRPIQNLCIVFGTQNKSQNRKSHSVTSSIFLSCPVIFSIVFLYFDLSRDNIVVCQIIICYLSLLNWCSTLFWNPCNSIWSWCMYLCQNIATVTDTVLQVIQNREAQSLFLN